MRKVKAAWCRPLIDVPKVCCVYCIYQGTKLLYVGSTINLRARVSHHGRQVLKTNKLKNTCVVQWIEVPVESLREAEQQYIDAYRFADELQNVILTAHRPRLKSKTSTGSA